MGGRRGRRGAVGPRHHYKKIKAYDKLSFYGPLPSRSRLTLTPFIASVFILFYFILALFSLHSAFVFISFSFCHLFVFHSYLLSINSHFIIIHFILVLIISFYHLVQFLLHLFLVSF